MNYQNQMKVKRFLRKPVVTYALLIGQILMFLLMTVDGGSTNTYTLIRYGAKFNPLLIDGEWWRLISPMFLHIGMLHLLMNSVILYYLGSQLEGVYGHVRFTLIYFLSGIAGNAASFAFSYSVSAGASTALFGLFASALVLGRTHRASPAVQQLAKNMKVLIIINLVFGFLAPSVDLAGHIGGLVGGFLAATAVSVPEPLKRWRGRRIAYGALFAALLLLCIGYGYYRTLQLIYG